MGCKPLGVGRFLSESKAVTNCEITQGLARFLRGILAETIERHEQALTTDMFGDTEGLLQNYRARLQELDRAMICSAAARDPLGEALNSGDGVYRP